MVLGRVGFLRESLLNKPDSTNPSVLRRSLLHHDVGIIVLDTCWSVLLACYVGLIQSPLMPVGALLII